MANKTADDCTYAEMDERFRAEVHRWGDERTIDSLRHFRQHYADMAEGELIRDYEARRGHILPRCRCDTCRG